MSIIPWTNYLEQRLGFGLRSTLSLKEYKNYIFNSLKVTTSKARPNFNVNRL